MAKVTPEDIDRGFELLFNFSMVQRGSTLEELQEAFALLLLSLGLNDDSRNRLFDRIYDYMMESSIFEQNPFSTGLLVLGIIVGLGIDQNAST